MAVLQVRTGWPSRKLSPNGRFHFREKAKASRIAKSDGYFSTFVALKATPDWNPGAGRLAVSIIALPPIARRRDDDNLIASAKNYLDGIAAALGVDDARFDILGVAWATPERPGALQFDIEAAQ